MAIQSWVAALDSLNFQVLNLERELEELANASYLADSANQSAIQGCLEAHAMRDGPASQRQEPLARPDMEAALHATPKTRDQVDQPPSPNVEEPTRNTPVGPAVSGGGLTRTYTGRLYLIFYASLDREGLELV